MYMARFKKKNHKLLMRLGELTANATTATVATRRKERRRESVRGAIARGDVNVRKMKN